MLDDSDPAQWRRVQVPAERMPGWIDRFTARHGAASWSQTAGGCQLACPDGAVAVLELPLTGKRRAVDGETFLARLDEPRVFGLVLVRRGGYAVGLVDGARLVGSRCGTRYVQGKTKAGGWSQQRYARRRQNQAGHVVADAAKAVSDVIGRSGVPLAGGGDRPLVAQTLQQAGIDEGLLTGTWLNVPDPRKTVLVSSVTEARSVNIRLNAHA